MVLERKNKELVKFREKNIKEVQRYVIYLGFFGGEGEFPFFSYLDCSYLVTDLTWYIGTSINLNTLA